MLPAVRKISLEMNQLPAAVGSSANVCAHSQAAAISTRRSAHEAQVACTQTCMAWRWRAHVREFDQIAAVAVDAHVADDLDEDTAARGDRLAVALDDLVLQSTNGWSSPRLEGGQLRHNRHHAHHLLAVPRAHGRVLVQPLQVGAGAAITAGAVKGVVIMVCEGFADILRTKKPAQQQDERARAHVAAVWGCTPRIRQRRVAGSGRGTWKSAFAIAFGQEEKTSSRQSGGVPLPHTHLCRSNLLFADKTFHEAL